jgi:DNA-binding transcriptional regulator LsrR (DeoR family)
MQHHNHTKFICKYIFTVVFCDWICEAGAWIHQRVDTGITDCDSKLRLNGNQQGRTEIANPRRQYCWDRLLTNEPAAQILPGFCKRKVIMGKNPDTEETEEFLCRVAWLYFVNGLTQSEIAGQLQITRLRVNKAISAARQLGIARVEIDSPFSAALDLQERLIERYGLRAAHVAIAGRADYSPHLAVGAALAFFLDDGLNRALWKSIGVSWGRTLETALQRMKAHQLPDIDIVSMIGGTVKGASFNAFGVAAGFAQKLGSQYSLFAAPIYFDSGGGAADLLASPLFQQQLEKARTVDIAILVAGDLSDRSFMVRDGLPLDVSASELSRAGAVGDLLGRFLDDTGKPIAHPLNERAIGISLDDLPSLEHVALAAAGPHKVAVIRAALAARYVHTLITDDVTAELLLKDPA